MGENVKPLATIMVVGDSHLSSENYGYHLDYPREALYYEETLTQIAEMEEVDYYINTGDLYNNKEFSLSYRAKVDEILLKRKTILERRGGKMIYLRGNHDVPSRSLTEYDYYVGRGVFTPAAQINTINIKNSSDELILELNLQDFGVFNKCECKGKTNILLTHGYFVFDKPIDGDDMPNYGTAIELDKQSQWSGLDYILCGHIHSEHIIKGILGTKECTVHYLPCLARPQYIKKLEEGPNPVREGGIDLIRVYEDHVDLERYPVEFLRNDVCFNVERIHNDAAKLEQSIGRRERKEALTTMAEELERYELREVDPIKQIEQLGTVEQKYKDIAISWFVEAEELIKTGKA